MDIKIICDQKDCRFNVGSQVHHDHDTDVCEHLCPQLASAPGLKIVCFSKSKRKDTITTHDLLEIDEAMSAPGAMRTGGLLRTNPKIG